MPTRLEDWIGADNAVWAIDAYIETLDLLGLGFDRAEQKRTAAGQPAYALDGSIRGDIDHEAR